MKNKQDASAATAALLEGLRQHVRGLWYQSETDAPLEIVCFPVLTGREPAAAELAAWAGKPGEEKVETVALAYFFRNMSRETSGMGEEEKKVALRFGELQRFLEQHLQEVKVYRIGHRKITALILGGTQTGAIAGLKTELVET